MTPEEKKKPLPYNTIPRYIAEDYRKGKIHVNQRRILEWLRSIGTPYGKATVSLTDLKHDVFPDIDLKINTVNSYLLKLRQKQYIYFEPRQGKEGTFDVELNHWLTPNGGYRTLEKYFPAGERRVFGDADEELSTSYTQPAASEDHQKLGVQNQKLREGMKQLAQGFSVNQGSEPIRSHHTNTDTEIDIQPDEYSTANKGGKKLKKVATRDFEPKDRAQRRCKEIALEVGDLYINFILGKLKQAKGDIEVIERGYAEFKETCREYEREGKHIENVPAFFNGLLEIFLINEGYEKL